MQKQDTQEIVDAVKEALEIIELREGTKYSSPDKLPLTTEFTQRTTVRVHSMQKEWGDEHRGRRMESSRELFYSFCIEFARHNPDQFYQFLVDYKANMPNDNSLTTTENPDEETVNESDDQSTSDSLTEEKSAENGESDNIPDENEPDSSPSGKNKSQSNPPVGEQTGPTFGPDDRVSSKNDEWDKGDEF